MDFKEKLIALYNEMRWKENKTVKEAQICRDFRVFVTTKFQDNDTRMTLNAVDRGDYDPEKKTLNPTLVPSLPVQAPQLSQPNLTNNLNTSDQSGNAVEVSGIDPDELLEMSDELAKEAAAFAKEAESWNQIAKDAVESTGPKKRGRKPKI